MVGSQSLLLLLGVVLLLFGGKKLPELAGSLGQSLKEFKRSVESPPEETKAATPQPQAATAPLASACASCKAAMEADWTHCPRCGTVASNAPVSAS
jgi:sec-independent protein translocase protein TatA